MATKVCSSCGVHLTFEEVACDTGGEAALFVGEFAGAAAGAALVAARAEPRPLLALLLARLIELLLGLLPLAFLLKAVASTSEGRVDLYTRLSLIDIKRCINMGNAYEYSYHSS